MEIWAYQPKMMFGMGKFNQAVRKGKSVDERLKYLVELKGAQMIGCEFCVDLGSQICRNSGLSDEALLALPRYRQSDLFTEREKLALDYTVAVMRTPGRSKSGGLTNLSGTFLTEFWRRCAPTCLARSDDVHPPGLALRSTRRRGRAGGRGRHAAALHRRSCGEHDPRSFAPTILDLLYNGCIVSLGMFTDRRFHAPYDGVGLRAWMTDTREVVVALNPVLRGWGNYFATGSAAIEFVQIDG
jgi:Carboxymuconolactone decarboxylase family/Group II intron, maturase-specific domain